MRKELQPNKRTFKSIYTSVYCFPEFKMYAYGHNLAITYFIDSLGLPTALQISPHYRSVGRRQGSCGVFGVSLSLSTFKQPFNNMSLNKNE